MSSSPADCLFCKIRDGVIVPAAKLVHQDDTCFAFRDIHPQAPTHILVVPRAHVASLDEVGDEHAQLLGHLAVVAARTARSEGLTGGWRAVWNTGPDAGQSVHHLHLHVLGGRALGWPPG